MLDQYRLIQNTAKPRSFTNRWITSFGVDISNNSQRSRSAWPIYHECVRPSALVVVAGPGSFFPLGACGVSTS